MYNDLEPDVNNDITTHYLKDDNLKDVIVSHLDNLIL